MRGDRSGTFFGQSSMMIDFRLGVARHTNGRRGRVNDTVAVTRRRFRCETIVRLRATPRSSSGSFLVRLSCRLALEIGHCLIAFVSIGARRMVGLALGDAFLHENDAFDIDFALHLDFVLATSVEFQGSGIVVQELFDLLDAVNVARTFDGMLN